MSENLSKQLQKNRMFNKTAEDAIFTFQYRDGEKQGQYQRVVGYKDWDFMNNQNPNGKHKNTGETMFLSILRVKKDGKFGEG